VDHHEVLDKVWQTECVRVCTECWLAVRVKGGCGTAKGFKCKGNLSTTIYIRSSYRAVNTLNLCYKNQSVNVV
jgi:hypothetical protein